MRALDRSRRREARETLRAREARLQRDLEGRGLLAPAARRVAVKIAAGTRGLSDEAYGAFLDGVAAAQAPERNEPSPQAAVEIQRLVQDFAVELKKLDEGLRLLSSYLLRIRDRTARETPRIVH